jgi:hypothetical protein
MNTGYKKSLPLNQTTLNQGHINKKKIGKKKTTEKKTIIKKYGTGRESNLGFLILGEYADI